MALVLLVLPRLAWRSNLSDIGAAAAYFENWQLGAHAVDYLAEWRAFARHGTRVIVTSDVPGMRPTSDPQCIADSRASYDPCAVSRASVVRPNPTSLLAQRHPELASYLPLTRFFCDPAKCHALIGGVVVYFDSHHLTTTFSRSLARYLGAEIAGVLAKEPSR